MDITKCREGVPSFSNKKISTDPISTSILAWYVRMYDSEMTVAFSSTIPVDTFFM
jgi:hypothetical protein